MKKRLYTWKRDKPDHRDFLYHGPTGGIPGAADLHTALPAEAAAQDQGNLGSCTGHGNARVAAFAHWKASSTWLPLSRLMIYFGERTLEGTVNQDAGAEIRDGIKALAKWGACDEVLWPYKVTKFKQRPPAKAYADGATRRIAAYHRVTLLDDIRSCIGVAGFPVVFGFSVPESFEGQETARTGVVAMPQPHEKIVGGHCMVWDAYDDRTQMLSGYNSWGPSWGDGGRFHMPYAYAEPRGLASDFWMVMR